MKRLLFGFIMCLNLLSLCIAGCTDKDENLATSTIEPSATPTEITIILPEVTLSPQENEAALQELLRTNGNCTGKCIGGIRPDEMTVQEAVDTLAQWGMVSTGENYQGKTYFKIVQDQLLGKLRVNFGFNTWTKKFETIDTVSFYIGERTGDLFIGGDVWQSNREAWQGFRLDNLLKAYGVPSYVGFDFQTTDLRASLIGRHINYGLQIQYEQTNMDLVIGALAYYNGASLYLCPFKDPHDLGVEINPERSLVELQRPVTWQALTDTDLDAFYQMFTDKTNPDACVTTNLEQIQTLQTEFH